MLEADPHYVSGISRTVEYHGYRFDIGGHRFFPKSREVEDLWTELLGPDLLGRLRSSKIYYQGKFFSYPLRPFEALSRLGAMESALCVLSFLKARLNPVQNPKSFEDWVVNEFGERLFRILFKTYTEKVWGMNCRDISVDWAANAERGNQACPAAKEDNEESRPGGEDPDRRVPLPTTGPGHDARSLCGKNPGAGWQSSAGAPCRGMSI